MIRYVIHGKKVLDRKTHNKYIILMHKIMLQLGCWKIVFQPHVVFKGKRGLEILFTK